MDFIQRDPVTGQGMRVTNEGRGAVDSINLTHIAHESQDDGTAYILATDFVALTTTGSFNGLLYFKNTDSQNRHFHIHHFRVCAGLCAAGSTLQVKVIENATTGTLISDANAAVTNNMNSTSSNTFGGNAYAASGDGKTITDGVYYTQFINHAPGHSVQNYDGAIIIGKNDSFAIEVKPSVAMTTCIELIGYFEHHD